MRYAFDTYFNIQGHLGKFRLLYCNYRGPYWAPPGGKVAQGVWGKESWFNLIDPLHTPIRTQGLVALVFR